MTWRSGQDFPSNDSSLTALTHLLDTVNKQSLDGQEVESTVLVTRVTSRLLGSTPKEGETEREGSFQPEFWG